MLLSFANEEQVSKKSRLCFLWMSLNGVIVSIKILVSSML